jgi:hypothetical protein
MTFDEQIAEAFETLTARVRGEVDREVRRVSAELVATARTEALSEGFTAGRDEGRREAEAAIPPPREEPVLPPIDIMGGERLMDATRAIDRARSLTAILDALVTAARAEARSADVWLLRGARLHQWRPAGSDARLSPDRLYLAGASADGLEVPIAIAGQTVAVLRTDLGTELTTEHLALRTQRIEVLTRYAAKSLESLTAFKTARALTRRAASPDAPDPAVPGGDPDPEEDVSARRYARLLVSEIKLYHESAVVDGRRDRDLATRLGGEIARARVMYEQRVPPDVRGRADYFHDELVRTLADGDAGLLEVRT